MVGIDVDPGRCEPQPLLGAVAAGAPTRHRFNADGASLGDDAGLDAIVFR